MRVAGGALVPGIGELLDGVGGRAELAVLGGAGAGAAQLGDLWSWPWRHYPAGHPTSYDVMDHP